MCWLLCAVMTCCLSCLLGVLCCVLLIGVDSASVLTLFYAADEHCIYTTLVASNQSVAVSRSVKGRAKHMRSSEEGMWRRGEAMLQLLNADVELDMSMHIQCHSHRSTRMSSGIAPHSHP